ncbi:MAG TPA: hypothetical protein VFV58_14800 [Blastocatellia bacterium]|jgi:hypothetical protein|nr:hypothetical protein [Blastocatellia bacterium]
MKQHNSAKKPSRRSFTKSIACSLAAAPFVSEYGPSPQPGAEATEPARSSNTTSTILAPVIFKDHIPPIEISSGSVFLHTQDHVEDHSNGSGAYPRKHVIKRGEQIKWVRVINTNGTILADYYGENLNASGGQIRLWVKGSVSGEANMTIRTAGVGGSSQLELGIDNNDHSFARDTNSCPTSQRKERRKYSDRNAKLLKVSVYNHNGDLLKEVITDPDREIEVDRIFIWTETAV